MIVNRRGAVAVAATLAAVAASLGPASPAAAAPLPGLQWVSETSNYTSSHKDTDVNCPDGKVVIGMGAYLTAPSTPYGYAGIDRLQPTADGTSVWVGTAEVVPYGPTWRHTAQVLCATQPAGWEIKSETGNNQQQYVTTLSCGTGRHVLGAGGRINGATAGHVVLEDIVPSSDLKTVTVRGVTVPGATDTTWSVTAYAVCANTPAGGVVRVSYPYGATDSTPAKPGNWSCDAGDTLYGVGIEIGAGNGNVLLSSIHARDEDSWGGRGDELSTGFGGNWNTTIHGICGS